MSDAPDPLDALKARWTDQPIAGGDVADLLASVQAARAKMRRALIAELALSAAVVALIATLAWTAQSGPARLMCGVAIMAALAFQALAIWLRRAALQTIGLDRASLLRARMTQAKAAMRLAIAGLIAFPAGLLVGFGLGQTGADAALAKSAPDWLILMLIAAAVSSVVVGLVRQYWRARRDLAATAAELAETEV